MTAASSLSLIVVVLDPRLELSLAIVVDRGLERPDRILCGGLQRLLVGLRGQSRDLRVEAVDLRFESREIGGGERRIELRQQLARPHLFALAHVDGADDRRVERLNENCRRFRDDDAARRHHLVDMDEADRRDQGAHHAEDNPDDAARRARHRRIDDRGGRPLELEDGRQRRIVPIARSLEMRDVANGLVHDPLNSLGTSRGVATVRLSPPSAWRFCWFQSWR